jgi:hypothetical protein
MFDMTRQPVSVMAYSGYRGEQEPRAMEVEGVAVEIDRIVRRWQQPDGRCFQVLDRNGVVHVLLCAEPDLTWWRLRDPDASD